MRRHKKRRPALGRLELLENRWLLTTLIALVDTGVDLSPGDRSYATDSPYYDLADSYNAYTQQQAQPNGSNVADNSFGGGPGHGHGSTVADALVAGIQAVAAQPGASAAAPKVMVVRDTDNTGQIDLDSLIRGIYYAADKGAKVINVSVGYAWDAGDDVPGLHDPSKPGATYFTLTDAINYARSKGVVVVAPAGNQGRQDRPTGVNIDDPNNSDAIYPAYIHAPNMIVAATADPNQGDALFSGSNWGPEHVDLASPMDGKNWQTSSWQTSYGSGYAAGVTGAIGSLRPDLVGDALASFVKENVQPVAALAGKVVTGGVLSPANLVAAASLPSVATPASASFNPSSPTTAALHVKGADPAGEGRLTYTWTVLSKPPGASSPSFSVNGTNAAKDAVATFAKAGTYVFQVTIADGSSHRVTSTASVTVAQVASSLSLTPASAALKTNATASFSAKVYDQFGAPLANPAPISWSVKTGGAGGTIDARGSYQAPSVAGTDHVVATYGTLSRTATVTISTPTPVWTGWTTWIAPWVQALWNGVGWSKWEI